MSEADLENMLLEAAGRTGASIRNKPSQIASKRQHHGSYSDDGSDSKDEYSDDDLRRAGRKSNGSQVPLKKRSKNRDDDLGSDDMGRKDGGTNHGGYSSDDSYVGNDLYKNENDREELSKMSELQREMILSERALKKDDRKLHKQMRSKMVSEKLPHSTTDISPLGSSRGLRSSTRNADKIAAKADALKAYKAKRMKHRSSNEHFDLREYSPKKQKGVAPFGSDSCSDSDDEVPGSGGMDYINEDRDKIVSDIPTFEQIRDITIKRSKLGKWFMEPFFEDLIVGCFVRVGIGMKDGRNVYRLCIVQNVDASDHHKNYQFESRTTHKFLNCVWGHENSAARWQMARISDSPPTVDEFNEWKREVDRSGGRMPHRIDVEDKCYAIEKINDFTYSAETVKQMLQQKKSVLARPLNIAAEKDKLRRELEYAQERDDEEEIERIQTHLRELQAVREGQGLDKKALKLAEMNRKNRAENYRVSSVKTSDRGLNPGDAGYDPFSRRWTRSTNYYSAKQKGEAPTIGEETETARGAETTNNSKDSKVEEGKVAQVAAAGAGKLTDTRAPVDHGTESNSLHNFDLRISLNRLETYGGAYGAAAAFLDRKQKIEAKIGCRVPEDDDRNHPTALSVGDYKRRRGLI